MNSATTSPQNQIDPRIAQYIYGANGNTGLMAQINAQAMEQLKTGGLNTNQRQGLDIQKSALMDPAYLQSYQQMRGVGQGLLSQPIAGNPFTSGQMRAPTASLLQPTQPTQPPEATQATQPTQAPTAATATRPTMTGYSATFGHTRTSSRYLPRLGVRLQWCDRRRATTP